MLAEEMADYSRRVAEQDDEAAFEKLFLHFYPGLFSFAFSYVRNRDWAAEITDDVLISLWENRKQLPAIRNLTYYLYVAARNGSLNCLKKNRRQETVVLDEIPEAGPMQFSTDPEHQLVSREILADAEKAINQLPPKCRLIFRLIKEEGLKYREVAALLGVSIKTVEAQITIALRKLEEALSPHLANYRRSSSR